MQAVVRQLRAAIDHRDLVTVHELLTQHARQLKEDQQTNWLNYFLKTEAQRNNVEMMAVLVQFGAEVNPRADNAPEQILHGAACEGAIEAVRWLLDHGAKEPRKNNLVKLILRNWGICGL